MKVSILIPVCQQKDEPRITIQSAKEAAEGLDYEIIVSDEHSTDGGCRGLPKDVLLLKPTGKRDGVSSARRRLAKAASGDILIWTDPHCRYPRKSFTKMVDYCEKRGGIIETNNHPKPRSRVRSGKLILSERGLRVARAYNTAARYPALYGTVYVMARELYDELGGWPKLPGIWGYSEQAMTLMSWFMDKKIRVMEDIVCIHKSPGKRFPYSVNRGDAARNALFIHKAFFPRTWDCFWEPIFRTHPKWAGQYDEYAKTFDSRLFKRFCAHVESKRHRQEEQFFLALLEMDPPAGRVMPVLKPQTLTDAEYQKAQERRSGAREYNVVEVRVKRALKWANGTAPLSGQRVLDVGTRNGYALEPINGYGATYSEGIEFARRSSEFGKKKGRNVVQGDMRDMSYADGAFGYVTCQHVLEHCLEPERGVKEMFRVLKPGGHMLLVVPLETATVDSLHYSLWPAVKDIEAFVVAQAGYKIKVLGRNVGILRHGHREGMLLIQKEIV